MLMTPLGQVTEVEKSQGRLMQQETKRIIFAEESREGKVTLNVFEFWGTWVP